MIRIQPIVPDEASSRSWWKSIVNQVAADLPTAWELLYGSLLPLRYEIVAKVGRDHADDLYHDTIVALVEAIRKGHLRTAEALPAFARTIAGRRVCLFLKEAVRARATVDANSAPVCDRSPNPEQERMRAEEREIARRILAATRGWQREVLTRFYLKQESAVEIQSSMQLTATQFRLMKNRAKTCFVERGRAYLRDNVRARRRT